MVTAAAFFFAVSSQGSAAFFGLTAPRRPRGSNITLRKRLHVNTLIAEPGTVEIDWSSLFSLSSTNFSMPSAVRYTPQGRYIFWGRTEYSLSFDSVDNVKSGTGRMTQFSQSLTVAATSVLHDGEKLDFAVQPLATFFLRDESGARIGAVAIARYDTGRHSMGVTASWTAGTHPSATNPAGTFDAGVGYGRRLAASGLLGKFTPHMNAIWEKSTGQLRMLSVYEGVEFQSTERLAFDLSGQHLGVRGATPDHQVALGITLNLGKAHQ